DGAGTGLVAAPERRGVDQIDALVDDDAVVGVRDGVLGEARLAEERADHGGVAVAVGDAAVQAHPHVVEGDALLAVADVAGPARRAAAAGPEAEDDVVAHGDALHGGSDGLDDTGALV